METRVIDQHDGIWPRFPEVAISHEDQSDERHNVQENIEKPHNGELSERIEQVCPSRRHPSTAKAIERRIWKTITERSYQTGAMQVAAGLARGNEDAHRRVLASMLIACRLIDPSIRGETIKYGVR
jgi:hypothetical protein